MFENVHVPVLGVVENMAYFTPPDLPDRKYYLFGEGGAQRLAAELDVPVLGARPHRAGRTREAGDRGTPVVLAEPESASAQAFRSMAASGRSSRSSAATPTRRRRSPSRSSTSRPRQFCRPLLAEGAPISPVPNPRLLGFPNPLRAVVPSGSPQRTWQTLQSTPPTPSFVHRIEDTLDSIRPYLMADGGSVRLKLRHRRHGRRAGVASARAAPAR